MKNKLISKRHEVFIEGLLAGEGLTKAGKKAGFTTPSRDAAPIIVAPAVRAHIRKRMRGRLEAEGAPAAYVLLFNTMTDESEDKRLRVDIAKFLYQTAGYTPPKALEPERDGDKAASEMSSEELRKFIEDGERELAERATPVIEAAQPLDELM